MHQFKTHVQSNCLSSLRGFLHGGRKILALGRSEKARKRFVCFTCRNFGRSGCQVEKEKKNTVSSAERPAATIFVLLSLVLGSSERK